MKRLPLPGVSWFALCLCCAAGCNWNDVTGEKSREELQAAREELRKCNESRQGLETVIVDQHKQIQTLQRLGDKRLDYLFRVTKIELGSYTGGVQISSKDGDDGIKVYLRPLDQDASVIKAPGDVKIQLFDLALGSKNNMIGEYTWPADKIGKQWFSDFMTYYYSFVCPWKNGLPPHDEITVRVEFVDYLTGKTFVEQKLIKVKLPASSPISSRKPIAATLPPAAPSVTTHDATAPATAPAAETQPIKPSAPTPAPVIPELEPVALPRPPVQEPAAPRTEAHPPKPETPTKPVEPAPATAPKVQSPAIKAQPPKATPVKVEPKTEMPVVAPQKVEPKIEPVPAPAKVEPKVETPAILVPVKVEPIESPAPLPAKMETPKPAATSQDASTPAPTPMSKTDRPKKLLVIPDAPPVIAPSPEAFNVEPPKPETPASIPARTMEAKPASADTPPATAKPAPELLSRFVEVKPQPAADTRPAATSHPTTTTAPVLLDTLAPVESPKKSDASAPANTGPDLGGPPAHKPGK